MIINKNMQKISRMYCDASFCIDDTRFYIIACDLLMNRKCGMPLNEGKVK